MTRLDWFLLVLLAIGASMVVLSAVMVARLS